MSTARSKQAIIDWLNDNPNWILDKYGHFEEPLEEEQRLELEQVQRVINDINAWARTEKGKEPDGGVYRQFRIKESVVYKYDDISEYLGDTSANVREYPDKRLDVSVDID